MLSANSLRESLIEIKTPAQYVGDNTRFLQRAFAGSGSTINITMVYSRRSGTGGHQRPTSAQSKLRLIRLIWNTSKKRFPRLSGSLSMGLTGDERDRAGDEKLRSGEQTKNKRGLSIEPLKAPSQFAENEWKYVADMVTELIPNITLPHVCPQSLIRLFSI